MTVDAIKDAIARLPEHERHSLAAWINGLDYDDWDKEMVADFSPGGQIWPWSKRSSNRLPREGRSGARHSLLSMTIYLKPEQERIIQAEIARGHFRNAEEVLDHVLAALREKELQREAAAPRKNLAQFLMESPFAGAELNLERQKDYRRRIYP